MSAAEHKRMLDAAVGGDDAALALLMRTYHDRVYRFGLRVCKDGFDADDAVQEAFTKLALRRDVLADPGALSWLMSVVRNACRRMLRPFARERRTLGERIHDADEVAEPRADPEVAMQRWQLVHAVHAGIAALDAPYRQVLVLRDIEGMSGPDASRALGIELATVKTRLHRARAQLRAHLRNTP